jgi:hypothetical protein
MFNCRSEASSRLRRRDRVGKLAGFEIEFLDPGVEAFAFTFG